MSHCPERTVSQTPHVDASPHRGTHNEKEEERKALSRLLHIAHVNLVQRAVRVRTGSVKTTGEEKERMYGIGVHEDPSSERTPTERERQPRVSVCVQAIQLSS